MDGQSRAEVVRQSDMVVGRLRATRKLLATLADAETGQLGYLLTGDPVYRSPYDRAIARSRTQLEEFRLNQPADRSEKLREADKIVGNKLAEMDETIRVFDSQGPQAALAIVKTDYAKSAMDKLKITLEQFIGQDSDLYARVHADIAEKSNSTSMVWFMFNSTIIVGMLAGMAGLWRASRKISELAATLEHEARHDGLTGLPNRAALLETLCYLIALAERENRRMALVFLDLNGFKAINDDFGHKVGDIALIEVGKALKRALRQSDFISRLGGDEFVVVVPSIDQACDVCNRIMMAITSISSPAFPDRQLDASIGVSVYPDDASQADKLISVADARMFKNKRAGTSPIRCQACK